MAIHDYWKPQGPAFWASESIRWSLELPLIAVVRLFWSEATLLSVPYLFYALSFVNTYAWAGMVDWGLRRFVDRPTDIDADTAS